jgi:hypothetical protein
LRIASDATLVGKGGLYISADVMTSLKLARLKSSASEYETYVTEQFLSVSFNSLLQKVFARVLAC